MTEFLKAIPLAASSPYAFAAYFIVLAAWLVLALYTKRQQQLLRHLEKVPENERAALLRAQMGAVSVRRGLSPEQWLRSRIHFYYFLAFAILVAALGLVSIIALVRWPPRHSGQVKAPTTGRLPVDPRREPSLVAGAVRLSQDRAEVVRLFGDPDSEVTDDGPDEAIYSSDDYYLQIIYGSSGKVDQFSLTSKSTLFHPSISPWMKRPRLLGNFSFADLDEYSEAVAEFNYSSKDWQYVEQVPEWYLPEGSDWDLFVGYNGVGIGYCSGSIVPELQGVLSQFADSGQTDNQQPSDQTKATFQSFRARSCPNAFIVRSRRNRDRLDAPPLSLSYFSVMRLPENQE